MSIQQMFLGAGGVAEADPGQQVLSTGSGNWTVPDGVFSISVVAVGGGGYGGQYLGGGGGALAYRNNVSVTPGSTCAYTVGRGGNSTSGQTNGVTSTMTFNAGTASQVVVTANHGAGYGNATDLSNSGYGDGNVDGDVHAGGVFTSSTHGDGGGSGGNSDVSGGYDGGNGRMTGAGGAGGYSGNGGDGGETDSMFEYEAGDAGSGGGGGGGGSGYDIGGDGGGVGILGSGSNGSGGSGGGLGTNGSNGSPGSGGSGRTYGGGGRAGDSASDRNNGGDGAIRIIWPGSERQFPSTRTADE